MTTVPQNKPASSDRPIRIIALTEQGLLLAERIQSLLNHPTSCIDFKPQPFTESVQAAFKRGEKLIFICAAAIAVRTLAPVLQDKYQDPPVLVLDEAGQFVVPLLSGHEGGANDWANTLAMALGAQAVITSAANYVNPVYTVGFGCERHCLLSYLEDLLLASLAKVGLTIEQIASFHTIELKKDEVQLLALAEKYGKELLPWEQQELTTMESLLSTKSDYVFNTVGVYGVAESACLYGAKVLTKAEPELMLVKQKNAKATCAIARGFMAP